MDCLARIKLLERVSDWLKNAKSIVCHACGREHSPQQDLSLHFSINKSLLANDTNLQSADEFSSYLRRRMRCSACGVVNAELIFLTQEEVAARQKRLEQEAAERKEWLESPEGKRHYFWSSDTCRTYATSGTRAYDPATGGRDVAFSFSIDRN